MARKPRKQKSTRRDAERRAEAMALAEAHCSTRYPYLWNEVGIRRILLKHRNSVDVSSHQSKTWWQHRFMANGAVEMEKLHINGICDFSCFVVNVKDGVARTENVYIYDIDELKEGQAAREYTETLSTMPDRLTCLPRGPNLHKTRGYGFGVGGVRPSYTKEAGVGEYSNLKKPSDVLGNAEFRSRMDRGLEWQSAMFKKCCPVEYEVECQLVASQHIPTKEGQRSFSHSYGSVNYQSALHLDFDLGVAWLFTADICENGRMEGGDFINVDNHVGFKLGGNGQFLMFSPHDQLHGTTDLTLTPTSKRFGVVQQCGKQVSAFAMKDWKRKHA